MDDRFHDGPVFSHADGRPDADQTSSIADRPGHDRRYAIDATRTGDKLDRTCAETFGRGIEKAVRWCLDDGAWWRPLLAAEAAEPRDLT